MTDTSRLDGGAEALAHIRKCPFIERPSETRDDVQREVRAPETGMVGADSPPEP